MAKMSNIFSQPVICKTLEHTKNFAAQIATHLMVGDTLFLLGDLGVGKTAFARYLIQSLCGIDTIVPSPTFTLVQMYDSRLGPLWHFDFYRLDTPEDIFDVGYEEAVEGVSIIEWPDKMGGFKPKNAIEISIDIWDHDTRVFSVKDNR